MGIEDPNNMEDVFFTFRGEHGDEHLSPSQLLAAQNEVEENEAKKTRLYPFIGANGVPQHLSPSQIHGTQNMFKFNNDMLPHQPGLYPRIQFEPTAPSSSDSGTKAPNKKKRSSKIKKENLAKDDCYQRDVTFHVKDKTQKENVNPDDYKVQRRGSLAHIHKPMTGITQTDFHYIFLVPHSSRRPKLQQSSTNPTSLKGE